MKAPQFLKRLVIGCAALCLLVEGFLFFTGWRLLLTETRSTPGQVLVVEGFGDLGVMSEPKLVCKFFNGRRVLMRVYHFSPNAILGRDACPVWLGPEE